MASFTGQLIKDTYDGIIKTIDNGVVDSTAKNLTDGIGNLTPLWVSTTQLGVGVTPTTDFHVNGSALIGGSLTITGDLTVNGSTTTISTQTLSVEDPLIILAKDNAANSVDIGFYGKYVDGTTKYAGLFRKAGDNKFHIFSGLGTEPVTTVNTSDASYVVSTLVGNLDGNVTGNLIATGGGATQIASDVRAVTQAAADSSTKVATTAFVQQELTGSDLDFSGTSGTGSVDLDSQTFAVVGTSNEIETTAGSQQLQIGLPNDVTIGNDLTVTNDLDVTGVITTAGVTEQATQFLFTKDLRVHDAIPAITLSDSDSAGAAALGEIVWIDSGATQKAIITLSSSNLIVTSKAGELQFVTNSTNALTIDTSQNATFAADLTVGGVLKVINTNDPANLVEVTVGDPTTAGDTTVGGILLNGGAAKISITQGENKFGIVAGGGGFIYNNQSALTSALGIGTLTNASLVLGTNNTARLTITGSGAATFAADLTVGAELEFGSLTSTTVGATIGKFVTEAQGIASNDNDTTVPTSAAVKDYVDTNVTAQDLDFSGTSGTGSVDLDSQTFAVVGTTNEIETTAGSQQLQIGLPSDVTIGNDLTVTNDLTVSVDANIVGVLQINGSAISLNNLSDVLIENNSIWLGNDPSATTSSALYNIAVGTTALDAITTGRRNIAIGYNALTDEDAGGDSIAIGNMALGNQNTSAESSANIAIGVSAGSAITTGTGNVLMGYGAGNSLETGPYNVILGYGAGNGADAGSTRNIFIGVSAGEGSSGGERSYNIGIGVTALNGLTTGDYNITLGSGAGNAITTGSYNIIIGKDADSSAVGIDNEIVIGNDAIGKGANTVVIGNNDTTAWLPHDDNGVDLGSSALSFKDAHIQGALSGGSATFAGTITGTTATFIKDQNADSIIQFYNANAGAAAQSTIYVGNSAVAADALFLGMNGTGMTTAGGFVADGAAIGSGSGASGGLTLFAREASSGIKFYTGGHTALALEIDSSQDATFAGMITVNGGGIDIDNDDDVRLRFDNASVFKAGLQVATTAGDMISGSAINDFCIRATENMLFSAGGNVESMRIDTSGNATFAGNVGIGAAPTFKLDSRTSTAGDRAVIGINSATTGTNYGGQFNCTGSGATKNIGLYVTAEGATTNVAAIFDSGNVGIGIDTPTLVAGKIVHIHGTAAGVHLTDTASGTTSADGGYVAFDNPNLYIQNKEAGSMFFETSGTTALTIDSSGNATFAGSAQFGQFITMSSTQAEYGYLNLGAASVYGWQIGKAPSSGGVAGNESFYLYNFSNSTVALEVDTGGKVIVGTDSSNALEVFSSGDTEIGFSYATKGNIYAKIIGDITQASPLGGELAFQTATGGTLSERMRIDSSGNVGIGTSSPDAKLSIGPEDTTNELRFLVDNDASGVLGVYNDGQADNYNQEDNGYVLQIGTRGGAGNFKSIEARGECILASQTGNVGIGTDSPGGKLHIKGDGLTQNLIRLQHAKKSAPYSCNML